MRCDAYFYQFLRINDKEIMQTLFFIHQHVNQLDNEDFLICLATFSVSSNAYRDKNDTTVIRSLVNNGYLVVAIIKNIWTSSETEVSFIIFDLMLSPIF